MSQTDLWMKIKQEMGGAIIGSLEEMMQLIPDSILFGSILLYLLTQNLAFGVFGVFIFETVLSHRLISWMFSQTVGVSRSITPDKLKCYSGFKTPQWSVDRILNHSQYPSYGIFSIGSIATYLLLATNEFSNTLDAMGTDWASRTSVAYSLIGLVLLLFISVRMLQGCDSIGEILTAMIFAILTGVLFYYVNKQLFGMEAMNFLGLPYLVSKESQGSPIYVCVKEEK